MGNARGASHLSFRLPFVAAVIVALLVVGSGIGVGAARSPEEPAERLVLRLHDLPPGYLPLDLSEGRGYDLTCAALNPESPGPRLERFVDRFSPEGCLGYYLRLYRVPGAAPSAPIVSTGAMRLDSVAATNEAFALSAALLAKVAGEPLEETAPLETVGEASRLFHWKKVPPVLNAGHRFGSFLAWRSGNVVAAVFASSASLASSDQLVTELAKRQQAHILDPKPYTNAERNVGDLLLDDPALKLPIYWLGSKFAPGKGFAPLRLVEAFASDRLTPRGPRASLLYSDRLGLGRREAVELDLRTPRQWKVHRAKGQWPFELHCAKTRKLDLPSGRATVYVGLHPGWRCDQRGPKVYAAVIRLPGVVITAETKELCDNCIGAADGPYNSFRGMATIARGLVLRPKPAY